MIRAGQLKEKAVVQRPQRVSNGSGGWVTEYVDVINPMYCSVTQLQPSADVIASQTNLIQPFLFVTRYRTDIVFEIGDRLVWRDRNFTLLGFKWDAGRTELVITAKTENETTSDGNAS